MICPTSILLSLTALLPGAALGQDDAVQQQDLTSESAALAHFEARIRPLLVDRCLECHAGPRPKGGLSLASREGWLRGGDSGPALVPGDAALSLLVRAVSYADSDLRMPPTGRLADAEIAALAAWVEAGAPDPRTAAAPVPLPRVDLEAGREHWAFQPIADPQPPAVADEDWPRNPIDRFVLARLEAEGLHPAPPATRREWLRRVTFDLIGLPPSPAELEAFLDDEDPGAEERVVDRLLASPHHGERWARRWLDIARYADSNGVDENLALGHAWRYRDWVVDALNADMPYDRFVVEQLAGDLLPPDPGGAPRLDALPATGFLMLGPKLLAEQDKRKLVLDVVDEQLDVASQAFLGLTIGCARCHDHKFDPISHGDYHALAGIFESTSTLESLDHVSRWRERVLGTDAELEVRERWQARADELEALLRSLEDDARAELAQGWRAELADLVLAAHDASPGAVVVRAEDFARSNLSIDRQVYGTERTPLVHTGAGGLQHAEYDLQVATSGTHHLWARYAALESRPMRLLVDGELVRADALAETTGGWKSTALAWHAVGDVELTAGTHVLRLEREGPVPHLDVLLLVARQQNPRRRFGFLELARGLLLDNDGPFALRDDQLAALLPPDAPLVAARAELEAHEALRPPDLPRVLAVAEGEVRDLAVLARGSHLSPVGEPVPRGVPEVLTGPTAPPRPTMPAGASGRLELARWITHPAHPLTARVAANRIWQGHFGEGIVRSPSNFGLRGDPPTHPELLDWLARELVAGGWSQKRLHRQIVLSSTYRQSSRAGESDAAVDPDHRLLAGFPRRRLEAEELRDALLAVAGTLDPTLGGSLLETPNREYVTNDQSNDAVRYASTRRSLYLPIVRNSIYDLFATFDYADPSVPLERRPQTTVAQQALLLLNSPLVLEASQSLAARATAEAGADGAERLERAHLVALGRPPTQGELERARNWLAGARATGLEGDPFEAYCQVLLASNEFLHVD